MLESIELRQKLAAPDLLRVYFFSSDNSLFSRSVNDYHRLFDVDAFTTHCAIQLGNTVYEVSLQGTTAYSYTPELDEHPLLLSYYELELNEQSEDARYAAEFLLRSYVSENRKLDWCGCLKYAANFLLISKADRYVNEYHSFNVPKSSISLKRSRANTKMLVFNLPYTCASQVIYVLDKLFDMDILCTGHLPTSLYEVFISLTELGVGFIWTNEAAFEPGE